MKSKNGHHPERHSNRIDKMNTKSYWSLKKMSNKKRRQLLKQNNQDKF